MPGIAQATGMCRCDPVAADARLSEAQLTGQITGQITAEGRRESRMKQDGGCCKVHGTTSDGKRGEAQFHPTTGAVRLINRRGTVLCRAGD